MAMTQQVPQQMPRPFFALQCGEFFFACACEPQKGRHFDAYEQEIDWEADGEGFMTAKSRGSVAYSFSRSLSKPSILDGDSSLRRSVSHTSVNGNSSLKRAISRISSASRHATRKLSRAFSVEVSSAAPPPDFSGTWQLDRVEGDWDKFTTEVGYSYMKRRFLGANGWGVGQLWQEIKMTPSKIWMKNSSAVSTTEIDVVIDKTEQDAVNPDHVQIKLVLWWEQGVLEADAFSKASGEFMARISRSVDDNGVMKETMRLASGRQVGRYFVRIPEGGTGFMAMIMG